MGASMGYHIVTYIKAQEVNTDTYFPTARPDLRLSLSV
jgi:hypothetical protein